MNLYTAILYVGSVNIWRGLWMLYDLYLLPGISVNFHTCQMQNNFCNWKQYMLPAYVNAYYKLS